ncbi:glycoside hydrolase family 88 protein [Viscerimonas tarda]
MVRVNKYFMDKYPDSSQPSNVKNKVRPSNIWTRGVYYEGLVALHQIYPKDEYYKYMIDWAEFHHWGMRNGNTTRNADDYCCGQIYIDLYKMSPQPEKIRNVKACMDMLVNTPQEDDWSWIDAIQMGMPVLAKLGELTGNTAYYEKMYQMYLFSRNNHGGKGLYNPEEGLWWRDADFVPPYKEPNGKNCYWSRGNGWVYAALVRVLETIPAGEAHRKEYVDDFIAMSEALKNCQRTDGFWNSSLHDPGNFGGKEATGTSLFVYGIAWGINNNLLDRETYLPVLLNAWTGLVKESVQPNGFLGWVQGTGKEPKDGQPLSISKIPDFEDYGAGCFLLAGSEMYKLKDTSPASQTYVFSQNLTNGILVKPSDIYSPKKGYGFDLEKNENTFFFSTDLPEGDYDVTLVLGSSDKASETTVRGESRRLFLEKIKTKKGEYSTQSFTVNIRNKHITSTKDVRLKAREANKLNWDNKLTLEFSGTNPSVQSIGIQPSKNSVTVFICGNSTVVDQDNEPWCGWGQMIPRFFGQGVAFANYAESGESASSFIGAGRLEKLLTKAKAGDYILVEFGHNDQKQKGEGKGPWTSFTNELKVFIAEARNKGCHPVLLTPTQRRNFDENGKIVNTHEEYPDAVRKLAAGENIPLIDLHQKTKILYEALGKEKSTKAFVHYPAGTYPGQAKELKDNTHFNSYGGYEIARCVIEGIKENKLKDILQHLRPDVRAFNPQKPDDQKNFSLPPSPFTEIEKPDGN